MTPEEMGEILGRLDERSKSMLEKQEAVSKRLDSHAEKIRSLEAWRNLIVGGGTVIAGLLGWRGH